MFLVVELYVSFESCRWSYAEEFCWYSTVMGCICSGIVHREIAIDLISLKVYLLQRPDVEAERSEFIYLNFIPNVLKCALSRRYDLSYEDAVEMVPLLQEIAKMLGPRVGKEEVRRLFSLYQV